MDFECSPNRVDPFLYTEQSKASAPGVIYVEPHAIVDDRQGDSLGQDAQIH